MGRVRQYLVDNMYRSFSWSSNNCMSFVSAALEVQGYKPLPDTWYKGYTTSKEAYMAYRDNLRLYGYSDIIEAMDNIRTREVTLHPRDGLIVAKKSEDVMGYAFGVVYAGRCFHLGQEGMLVSDLDVSDMYWS
jgi:hypothetical protein